MEVQVNTKIFRAYDIRGRVEPDGLTENVAYSIGLAFGSLALEVGESAAIVARDGRLSGPEMKAAFVEGLLETGINVIDIGVVASPLLYFATHQLSSKTGVMVTASHNPKDHNGFKMVLQGKTLTDKAIQSLAQRIEARNFRTGQGIVSSEEVLDSYWDYIKTHLSLKKPLTVVVDAANAAASHIAPQLYEAMGCRVIPLYCELDGNFPNHHPDPSVLDNLKDLIAKVKSEKADIGLAFDGDADRLGVVTNTGEVIWPDRQLMLFAQDILTRIPGADIVFDVKCSSHLAKVIRENGGNPIMYRTGHSLIKNKMAELDSPLSGEMSGHIFYREDWFGFDDGMYVGARLLEILSKTEKTSSELFHTFPDSVNTPELKLKMPEDKKPDFMKALLETADFEAKETITIDGLRVEYDDGWGLVRPSNTAPCLTLRFEAEDQASLERVQSIFRREFLKIDQNLELPF